MRDEPLVARATFLSQSLEINMYMYCTVAVISDTFTCFCRLNSYLFIFVGMGKKE